jgi:predicted site-specific integrase-resolvase
MIKLKKFASDLGVTRMTLWNWKKAGKIQFHKIGSMNYIDVDTYNKFLGIKEVKEERVVIYCRVSSTANKTNLETQSERLISYCNAKGYRVSKVVTEFRSGLNDKRPKLEKLLKEQDFTKLVVEHKDRLTRFGFNYIEQMLAVNGIQIEVVNNVESDREDIVQDFVSVITSFCARIYGQRRNKRHTEKLVQDLALNSEKSAK